GTTRPALARGAGVHDGACPPQWPVASDTHDPWLPAGADIIQEKPLAIHEGSIKVPEGAGVGVSLDPDRLARANETYRKCGMKERDDAFTMRLVEPKWQRTLY